VDTVLAESSLKAVAPRSSLLEPNTQIATESLAIQKVSFFWTSGLHTLPKEGVFDT
jgi:hypothetical protein